MRIKEHLKNYLAEGWHMLLAELTPIRVTVGLFACAFLWFVLLGDKGITQLTRLIEMKNRLLKERSAVISDIDRLAKEKQLLSDPANLEMVIRKELGYIRPGEIVFEEKNQPK